MRLPFFRRSVAHKVSPATNDSPPDGHYAAGDTIAGRFAVLDRYEGGLGFIYVVDDGTGPFVLKAPKGHLNEATSEAFAREARVWVQLGRHPNIVPAFWVDEIAGQVMVAAEYIEPDAAGRTSLRDILSSGPINLSRTFTFAADFCFGMGHAEERGLWNHRDIKPENLLVGASGFLQITDFGLAFSLSEHTKQMNSKIAGTPSYMAPEQWLGREQTIRTDLYAFGIVLYEMCFGRLPWKPGSLFELRAQHLKSYPQIPSHPLSNVIEACLEKNPDHRPRNPNEVFSLIDQIARDHEVTLPPRPQPSDDEQAELLAIATLGLAGDQPRALAAAKELTERWPDYARGWTQLGRIYFECGDLHSADQATRRSLHIDPTRSPAWNNLGLIFSSAGQWDAAITALEVALDIDPKNTGAMLNLSRPLTELRRYEEAANRLTRASELASDKFEMWVNLGSVYKLMGRNDGALAAWRKALELAPPEVYTKISQMIKEMD